MVNHKRNVLGKNGDYKFKRKSTGPPIPFVITQFSQLDYGNGNIPPPAMRCFVFAWSERRVASLGLRRWS